jgi:hypothetical protein
MVDEGDENAVELAAVRPFSWFMVALIAVDATEDTLDVASGALGKLRAHMAGHIRWNECNAQTLREIESLPEI